MATLCRFSRFLPLLIGAILVLCIYGLGQSDTAMLSGRVVDPSGLNINGALVELVNVDRNVAVTTKTNSTGLYIFPSVQPGNYRMRISSPNFTTVNLTSLTLNVQDSREQNFRLAVGSVAESITVEAKGNLVDVSNAVSTNVDQQFVKELPLNGRSFQTLFQLTPGVVITATDGGELGQFSVNGQRPNANYFTVDGVSANVGAFPGSGVGQTAGGSVPALTAGGGTNSLVSVDALEEFSIQTSGFAPEYGRTPGGQISILTRSGTNDFHGDVFDYLRNDAVDANDWFANNNHLPRGALRQNDFGGVVGGPIFRNRTFFFFSYEGLRLTQPVTGISDVPDLAARQAAIPAMQQFINAFPLPNGPEEGGGLAFANYTVSNLNHLDTESLRFDHQFRPDLSLFVRYNHSTSEARVASRLNSLSLNSNEHFKTGLHTLTSGVAWAIRPILSNDFRFNWSWSSVTDLATVDKFQGAVPFDLAAALPGQDLSNSSFDLAIVNSTNAALETGPFNKLNLQRQVNLVDILSWQIGRHLVKFGFDYRRLTPQVDATHYSQSVFFDTPADLGAGFPSPSFGAEVDANYGPIEALSTNYSLFGQDTWKVRDRLTLTYGLRWDYNPTISAHGQNGLPILHVQGIANLATASPATPGSPLYKATADNFAPRLGFSYKLRDSSNYGTVLRGGVGMFYDLGNGPVGLLFSFSPFNSRAFPFPTAFPLTGANAAKPGPSLTAPFTSLYAFPRTLRQPYTYQFNLGLEQAMTPKQTLTVAYVGAAAHGLLRRDVFSGPALTPNIGELNFVSNSAYSHYDSLQVQVRRHHAKQLEILASYTWAHSRDNASAETARSAPTANLSPARDYGNSGFDIRHTGSLAFDYQIPSPWHRRGVKLLLGGWGLNAFLVARTATPVDVTLFRDIGFGFLAYRPDTTPGVSPHIRDPKAPGGLRLNPAAFSVPAAAQQGNLGRNSVRGFALFQQDFSIRRTLRLSDKLQLQARVEAFNVFNHPNFSSPLSSLGFVDNTGTLSSNPSFGVSTSMFNQGSSQFTGGSGFNPLYQIGGPRSLQAAVKLEF
jgi:hypothetical protein